MSKPIGDLHIDDFCKDTAKILLSLYKSFPVKTTLYVEDISGPDQPDEFGLHSPRFEACFSAMIWLKESDYIYFSGAVRQEAVEEAVLTHRGFSFLSSVEKVNGIPEDGFLRRIDHLHNTAKEGNSETIKSLILRYMVASRDFN